MQLWQQSCGLAIQQTEHLHMLNCYLSIILVWCNGGCESLPPTTNTDLYLVVSEIIFTGLSQWASFPPNFMVGLRRANPTQIPYNLYTQKHLPQKPENPLCAPHNTHVHSSPPSKCWQLLLYCLIVATFYYLHCKHCVLIVTCWISINLYFFKLSNYSIVILLSVGSSLVYVYDIVVS